MKSNPPPDSEPEARSKKLILIVDDDPAIVTLVRDILEKDYDVIEASYSLPALFQVGRETPDLMLVDLHMPIMGGLELIEQLKTYTDTRHIPIVAITGMDTPQARAAADKLGCVAFIAKPFHVKSFLKTIAGALRK